MDLKIQKPDFMIEIRDRSFNVLERFDSQIEEVKWDYSAVGGCGNFSFTLPRNYCDEKYISGNFNIRIYIWNESTQVFDIYYQGKVIQKIPTISNQKETVDVSGAGYFTQLKEIQFNETYLNMEISDIVKDILDNNIVGIKDITYDDADIDVTDFTASKLVFNTDVQSALKTCADLATGIEWGVDRNRKFFFKQRSTTPGKYFVIGKNIINFKEVQDFGNIVNHVVVQGGDISGTPYTKSFDYASSQLKFGRMDTVEQNSSITTDDVAQQYADSIYAAKGGTVRQASCDLVGYKDQIESTVPIPLLVLIADSAFAYGTKKYGTGLYSGLINRPITRVSYSIDSNRALEISLNLGFLLPAPADDIQRLDYKLEQLRNSNL